MLMVKIAFYKFNSNTRYTVEMFNYKLQCTFFQKRRNIYWSSNEAHANPCCLLMEGSIKSLKFNDGWDFETEWGCGKIKVGLHVIQQVCRLSEERIGNLVEKMEFGSPIPDFPFDSALHVPSYGVFLSTYHSICCI